MSGGAGGFETMRLLNNGARHESDDERDQRLQAELERQEAYAAVAKAIAQHRWWGFTSLLQSFRLWVTSVRFRLGMKLWP